MGMTIDNAIKHMEQARYDYCEYWEETRNDTTIAFDMAIDTMRKYQMMQADYENRLKADLKAILVELQLEIEEIKPLKPTDDEDWQYGCFHGLKLMQDKCLKLIQQKIDKLKEGINGENNN